MLALDRLGSFSADVVDESANDLSQSGGEDEKARMEARG